MKKHTTIKRVLESWGKGKRLDPERSEILKAELLAKIPTKVDLVREPLARRPLPLLSFGLVATALILVFVNVGGKVSTISSGAPGISVSSRDESGNNFLTKQTMPDVSVSSRYFAPTPYISDNREFLKTNLSTVLQTRKVAETKDRAEIIIRGVGGRIDNSSAGKDYGYVSFAIPRNEIGNLRLQLRDLVGVRFYSEQSDSTNLLPEKQTIERNQAESERNLGTYKVEREQLILTHTRNVASFQNQIRSYESEATTLGLELRSATTTRKAEIVSRMSELQREINTALTRISDENRSYQQKIGNIDQLISNEQNNIEALYVQDKNLVLNVETVNGSITIKRINIWTVADVYVAGPLLAWVLVIIAMVTYLWTRSNRILTSEEF